MTNEEAIKAMTKYMPKDNDSVSLVLREAMNMGIKALEQEPCEDCISREQLVRELNAQMAVDAITEEVAVDMLKHLPSIQPTAKENLVVGDCISRDEVIDILLNEMECVQRASDKECNRDCAKCDLLRDTNKILQAYRISIKALEHPEENVVAIMPCGDAISRQAVLAIAGDSCLDLDSYEDTREFCDAIKELPPVTPQPKTEWIPVSERLPEPFSYVNCTCHSLIDDREDWVVETFYLPLPPDSPYSDWGNIPMLNWGECEVIAWMYRDIPKPYKAESEGKE